MRILVLDRMEGIYQSRFVSGTMPERRLSHQELLQRPRPILHFSSKCPLFRINFTGRFHIIQNLH